MGDDGKMHMRIRVERKKKKEAGRGKRVVERREVKDKTKSGCYRGSKGGK